MRASAGLPFAVFAATLAAQQTHSIRVNPDGTFSPRILNIRSGDTVRWEQLSRGDSVIPVTGNDTAYPALCLRRAPYAPTDANDLTGPLGQAPPGIFAMGIHGAGYRESTTGTCPGNVRPTLTAGNKLLCVGAGYQATMDATWKSPNNTGVFIRLLWKDVNPAEGRYDFTVLEREMENAVAAGKLFSLSIKAGANGTPDWIFSTNPDNSPRAGGGGGVPRLHLEDDDDALDGVCGQKMDLGNPTNPRYQQLYFNMMVAVANFIKSRSDWFRALAYIKTSGANLVSEENRLPNHCSTGCACNTRILAEDGYRPSKLLAYYTSLMTLLRDNFPGKSIVYALIQDGFPRINETGGYLTADGRSSDRNPLPAAFEQTQDILDAGQTRLGPLFVVAHNGVQPKPVAHCNFEGQHPKPVTTLAGYWDVGSGCPNRWAVREGAEGQITGYQTTNFQRGVSTPAEFESAMANMWDNTDGIYMELYEEMFWLISNTNGGVLPSGKTTGAWADNLFTRRTDPIFRTMAGAGNPYPATWSRTLRNTNANGAPLTLTYIHGSKCGAGNIEYGQIIIDARVPAIRSVISASGFGGATSASPGTWIEIYGSNLSATTREWSGTDFAGSNAPTSLDGVSVRIGALPAFVSYISPVQINAQVPSGLAAGAAVPVIVTNAVGSSTAINLTISGLQPGLSAPASFNINGRQYAVAQFPDGAYALPADAIPGLNTRPARPGDTVTFYGVGFGPVTPAIGAGQVAAGVTSLNTAFQLSIAGTRANLTYSGLAPGAVGLYQFNVTIPRIPASDAAPVAFSLGGVPSTQSLFIATQN
ncbi:MAG: beta-galactosidase [Bryobacteraceae bacterium]